MTTNKYGSIAQQPAAEVKLKKPLLKRIFPNGYKDEAKELLFLAIPTILTALCQVMPQSISIIMCGHLSRIELDAVALANSIINIAGVSIGMGLSTACDTFFSQTYGGGNKKRMGMYLQRSFMVINLFLLPLFALHLTIEPVLRLLGQDEEISAKAATYILLFLPGLFFDFNFLILARYLQNQNAVYPPMICAFIANIYNAVSQYVAIYIFNFRFEASAVCQASCMFLMVILLLVYILISGTAKPTWAGWTIESLYDWSGFIKLGLPGIFLIALEVWSYEVTVFIAGTLSDVQLGAQSVIFQIGAWIYMIPMGLGVAVNIRVGQQVGDFNKDGAITSYRVALTFICVTSFLLIIVFLTLPTYLPMIFTPDKEIISVVASVIPIFGVYQLVDGVNACSIGVLRGCGRQLFGATVVFITYYVIALPVGIPVTLWSGLQIQGMWFVMFSLAFGEAVFMFIMIYFQNWNRYCVQAQIRAHGDFVEEPLKKQPSLPASESEDFPGQFDDEEKALLESSDHYQKKRIRRYSGRTQSTVSEQRIPLFATYDKTKFKQILCHRMVILILCSSILVVGVILRITFLPLPLKWTQLCLPLNSNFTWQENVDNSTLSVTLPWCNETVIHQ